MNNIQQLDHFALALLARDKEDFAHKQERVIRLLCRGRFAAEDLQYSIRHNCAAAVKAWSASTCMWFGEWLMLRNPVIGRRCVVLAPTRK